MIWQMAPVLVATDPLHLQALNIVLYLLKYDFEYVWQPLHIPISIFPVNIITVYIY